MRSTHHIVDRFLRVNQGHPLTVWVGMGGGVEVKKQGHHQFSLRFLGRRGQADLLGEGVLLAGGTSELGLTALFANVSLHGVRTLPVAVRHHLVFGGTGHGEGVTAVGAKSVKVEPVMVEAACYEHGLEPVGQGGVVQREQAVAFVGLEQSIEGRPELRPHGVLGVFTDAERLAGMNHDTMLVDFASLDGRDFGRTLRRHESHPQSGMKIESNVEVATSVACRLFALLLAILHVRAHEHGRVLDEFIGVLEQLAHVLGGQAGLGVRRRTTVLDQQLPHLASLDAHEGLEVVNDQRRHTMENHPLGKVTAVFSQAFDGQALLHTEVNHAGVELLGQPLREHLPVVERSRRKSEHRLQALVGESLTSGRVCRVDTRGHLVKMVLDERADGRRGFLTTHEVVLCIRFRFDRGAVVLHVRATGVATYEGVAYRLTALCSIDFGISVKCRVDVRNAREQCPDIPLKVTEPKRQSPDMARNFYDGAR